MTSKANIFLELPENLKKFIETTKKFPTLYTKIKRGTVLKDHYWDIEVNENDEGYGYIKVVHGDVGGEPSIPAIEIIKKGKNEGKINETSAYEQAFNEAKSKFAKRFKRNASLDPEVIKKLGLSESDLYTNFYPMLALKYDKKYLKLPAAISPKLDGIRAVTMQDDEPYFPEMYSREMKSIPGYHEIREELNEMYKGCGDLSGCYIDGEIYSHNIPFEQISGLSRKKEITEEDIKKMNEMEYHIFDIYCPDNPEMGFKDRYSVLKSAFSSGTFKHLKLVPTFVLKSEDEISGYLDRFVNAKYEGAIVRNMDSVYKVDGRSNDLLKIKKSDKEFVEITDISKGKEVNKPNIVFSVKNSYGLEFSINANSTEEYRNSILENKESYIGKQLLIKFDSVTKTGKPRFARPEKNEKNQYIIQ